MKKIREDDHRSPQPLGDIKRPYGLSEDLLDRSGCQSDGRMVTVGTPPGLHNVRLAGTGRQARAGSTPHNVQDHTWNLGEADQSFRFLIRDRDRKFTEAFDTIFRSEGLKIIRTPIQAPNANSYAERWVRSARSECLDKIIIVNQAHLRSVLTEYVTFYNTRRPHQGIDQQSPIIRLPEKRECSIQKRPVLGGIINDYYRMAA